MDAVVVVQIREVCLVGGILPAFPDAAVILSPLLAECLPFSPGFLDRVVPVTGPEHLPQVIRNLSLVPVAHVTYYVAFEVRGASLKLRAGEDLTDDILQSFQTVSAYQTDLPTPRSYRSLSISPQPVALSVGLLYMPNTSRVLSSLTERMT